MFEKSKRKQSQSHENGDEYSFLDLEIKKAEQELKAFVKSTIEKNDISKLRSFEKAIKDSDFKGSKGFDISNLALDKGDAEIFLFLFEVGVSFDEARKEFEIERIKIDLRLSEKR